MYTHNAAMHVVLNGAEYALEKNEKRHIQPASYIEPRFALSTLLLFPSSV